MRSKCSKRGKGQAQFESFRQPSIKHAASTELDEESGASGYRDGASTDLLKTIQSKMSPHD
jgi:hypothetical protein